MLTLVDPRSPEDVEAPDRPTNRVPNDESEPTRLSISLLNGFAAHCGSRALALTSNVRKLLALLAVRDLPTTRRVLAATLWPEADAPLAASSLRSSLWRLKHDVGDVVEITGRHLSLRSDVDVDLWRARSLAGLIHESPPAGVAADLPAEAVRLLSGNLLPGWYDDWVLIEAAEWHARRLHALEELATELAAEGRNAEAIGAALAAVRIEPLREEAHRALIETFLNEGNQVEAIEEFVRYRDLLATELGIEPSAHLCALVDGLLPSSAAR